MYSQPLALQPSLAGVMREAGQSLYWETRGQVHARLCGTRSSSGLSAIERFVNPACSKRDEFSPATKSVGAVQNPNGDAKHDRQEKRRARSSSTSTSTASGAVDVERR